MLNYQKVIWITELDGNIRGTPQKLTGKKSWCTVDLKQSVHVSDAADLEHLISDLDRNLQETPNKSEW